MKTEELKPAGWWHPRCPTLPIQLTKPADGGGWEPFHTAEQIQLLAKERDGAKAYRQEVETDRDTALASRDAQARRIAELEHAILQATEERDQVARECTMLTKDKDRLDWLEKNPRLAEIHIDGRVQDCFMYAVSGASGVRLRDIIDAVRKPQAETPEDDVEYARR